MAGFACEPEAALVPVRLGHPQEGMVTDVDWEACTLPLRRRPNMCAMYLSICVQYSVLPGEMPKKRHPKARCPKCEHNARCEMPDVRCNHNGGQMHSHTSQSIDQSRAPEQAPCGSFMVPFCWRQKERESIDAGAALGLSNSGTRLRPKPPNGFVAFDSCDGGVWTRLWVPLSFAALIRHPLS